MAYNVRLMLDLDEDGDWAGLDIELPFVPVVGMVLSEYLRMRSLIVTEITWLGASEEFLVGVKLYGRETTKAELIADFMYNGWELPIDEEPEEATK